MYAVPTESSIEAHHLFPVLLPFTPVGSGPVDRSCSPMKGTVSGEDRARRLIGARTVRMALWMGLPAVAILVGFALALYMKPGSHPSDAPVTIPPRPIVAVLPMIDLDGAHNVAFNEAFVDEIDVGLTMVQDLELRGRVSARSYNDVNRDAGQAGALLGAAVVLDAASRRSGGHFRIAARLIDTRSGAVIWSGVQDTTLAEWFVARDAIVEGVASALGLRLGEEQRRRLARRRTDAEAFDLYAQGRFGWAESEGGDLLEAMYYYHLAIEADSSFAPAWTALAEAYVALPRFSRFPVESVRYEGAAAARTALRIDPDGADAHAVLGEILFLYERDYSGGRAHLERAVELDPGNGNALTHLCELAMYEGRLSMAEDACRRAVEADAFAFHAAWLQANLHKLQDDFGGALAGLDSLRSIFPEYLPLSADVLFTRLLVGDSTRGSEDLQYWIGLLGGSDDLAAELSAGNVVLALRRLTAELDPAPSDLTALSALLGDYPSALEAAVRAVRERDPGSLRFAVFPEYERLRERAEFQLLLSELNLTSVDGQ